MQHKESRPALNENMRLFATLKFAFTPGKERPARIDKSGIRDG